MTDIPVIQKITDVFGPSVRDVAVKNNRRVIMTIDPANLPQIAEYIYKTAGFRFIIATALHTKKGFEIHYHFSLDSTGLILNLHVILDMNKPEDESLSNMF